MKFKVYVRKLLFPLYLFPIKLIIYTAYYLVKFLIKFIFAFIGLIFKTIIAYGSQIESRIRRQKEQAMSVKINIVL